MRLVFLSACFFVLICAPAQDSAYARKVIRYLTSEKCYGRGYLKDGLHIAAKYIAGELKATGVTPLFATGYFQPFSFDVNTFPGKISLEVNGKSLQPGADFIPSPDSRSLSGSYNMIRKDSVTYIAADQSVPLVISLKKKLTFSVARQPGNTCEIELLNKGNFENITSVKLSINNKVLNSFPNNNICGYIDGTSNNDSMFVFSAHYDHLGGIGKKTFFPGANDNASGVSVLLNLARYYKANPPRYRILFLFFAGEEAGLLGSHFFVDSKAIDPGRIKFLINLDLLGTGDDGIMVVNGAVHQKEFALMQQVNDEKKLVKEIKKRGKARNSDHYWFEEAGVPTFFIYTMGGVTSYHDVFDIERTLPLTDYIDVLKLVVYFTDRMSGR